jgi:hypothetical protein
MHNKFLVFVGSEFIYYDFTNKKWDIGDLIQDAASNPVHDLCSLVRVQEKWQARDKDNKFSVIVTGGKNGKSIVNRVTGYSFK